MEQWDMVQPVDYLASFYPNSSQLLDLSQLQHCLELQDSENYVIFTVGLST